MTTFTEPPNTAKPVTEETPEKSAAATPTAEENSLAEPRSRRWRRRAWSIARDLAIFAAIVLAVQTWRARDLVGRGEPAPELDLFDLDGRRHVLSSYEGKPVLVHFWATWCGVCRREFGALNTIHAGLDDDAILLTVVEDGDDLEHVAAFAAERGLDYPILLAEPDTIESWRIDVFPTNYFIGPDGNISQRQTGMATRWGMRFRLWMAGL